MRGIYTHLLFQLLLLRPTTAAPPSRKITLECIVENPVQVFNKCIDSLANAIRQPRIDPLDSQVDCWEKCSNAERVEAVQKADEVCQLMCDVIVPNDGEQLFHALVNQHQNKAETSDAGFVALVAAYQNAPSKTLKT